MQRRTLNENNRTIGITTADYWTKQKYIEEALFTDSIKGKDIDVFYMDMCKIHEFSDVGYEFFMTMSETEMIEIFDIKLI